jgi:UDP-N-acetylmuramoylalanine--D-glutamate ligase
MSNPETNPYRDQRVAVLGLGRSGEAAARLLANRGARVTVLESGAATAFAEKAAALNTLGIETIFGEPTGTHDAAFDLAVMSPGIDPATPLAQNILARGIRTIAEIELAHTLSRTPVVAITGTNGKTTTTELVAAMLLAAGTRTVAGGNIGKPYSEIVLEEKSHDVLTLEVSSFQLERIETFRPRVAVWLNLTPDHLDRYRDLEEYRAAKLRVFDFQERDDDAIVNAVERLPSLRAKRTTFNAYAPGADFALDGRLIRFHGELALDLDATRLRGLHNAENAMAALGVARALGLSFASVIEALRAYQPAPHRCELVAQRGGIDFVNDSKATNLDALEKALRSEERPVVLIAGGKDKGFTFGPLAHLVATKVRRAVLIGEMAGRIESDWRAFVPCEQAGYSLERAVQLASEAARPGDVVLFSPGTSSFDMFKNYAERGDQFRALAQSLS